VDDAVGLRGSGFEAVEVVKRSAMDFGAGGGQGRRFLVRPAQAKNLMARPDHFLDDGRADESGRSSDKYAHEKTLQFSVATNLRSNIMLVK
jgi:hypothetical protein